MSHARLLPLLAVILLSGCAAMPQYSDQTFLSMKTVVDAVQCELKTGTDAMTRNGIELGKWGAAYTLTLKVDNKNNLAISSVDWAIPISGGTTSLGPSAKIAPSATREGKVTLSFKVRDLGCPAPSPNGDTIFNGNLGVRDWLVRTAQSGALSKHVTQINYTVGFVVEMSADLKPGIKLVNWSAGTGVGVSQTRTNQLTLTLSPEKTPEKKAGCSVCPGR